MSMARAVFCGLLAALLLAGPVASAVASAEFANPPATEQALSVEEVALLVLQRNRDLRVRRLEPVIAGTFEQIERGAFDAELFAEAAYERERSSETSRSSGTRYDVDAKDSTAVAGLRQFLPTGTSLEATVEHERGISNRAPEQQTGRVGLTLTQSLLRGLGPSVNLASVRQAELATSASRYELRAFTEALLAEAETAYWNLVLARKQIAIFESSLAVARQQRDETELRIEVGLLPPVEAAAARAEVAQREQALIDARSLLQERLLRLLHLIDRDPAGRRIATSSEPRIETVPPGDLNERLRLAEKMRPELNEARMQLEKQVLQTVVTRNGLLPRLDFFITLGKTGYADTLSGSFGELGGKTYDLTAGFRLSRALGNRADEARHLAATSSRQQAREALDNLRRLVRLEVRLAANELQRAARQITATAATRALQAEALAAEQARFAAGTGTSLLVAQAQRDLLAGRIDEVEAVIQYRIALVNLYLAEGSLLERRGIRLEP